MTAHRSWSLNGLNLLICHQVGQLALVMLHTLWCHYKQGKSGRFDCCEQPGNWILSKSSIFQPVSPSNLIDDLKNDRAPLLYYIKLCASFQIYRWIQTEVIVQKCSIRVKIGDFFVPCDLEIWCMTLENNRTPLLYYIKLCASFRSHWWIKTGVTVRKHPIRVKIWIFLSRVTLKFEGWPWKTIGHLFYVVSTHRSCSINGLNPCHTTIRQSQFRMPLLQTMTSC